MDKNVNPDVLCLQETKVMDESFPLMPFEELGYEVLYMAKNLIMELQ